MDTEHTGWISYGFFGETNDTLSFLGNDIIHTTIGSNTLTNFTTNLTTLTQEDLDALWGLYKTLWDKLKVSTLEGAENYRTWIKELRQVAQIQGFLPWLDSEPVKPQGCSMAYSIPFDTLHNTADICLRQCCAEHIYKQANRSLNDHPAAILRNIISSLRRTTWTSRRRHTHCSTPPRLLRPPFATSLSNFVRSSALYRPKAYSCRRSCTYSIFYVLPTFLISACSARSSHIHGEATTRRKTS